MLRLAPFDFWGLTFRDFWIKSFAHRQELENWERVIRLQTYFTISPHIKDRIEPIDLWTLPSEQTKKMAQQSAEDSRAEQIFLDSIK